MTHPETVLARAAAIQLDIPRDACDAYLSQFRAAKRRSIEFEFDLPTWWAWWQTDGRWERRGRQRGQMVMARFGDVGPYAPENVFAASPAENVADRDQTSASDKHKQNWASKSLEERTEFHLAVRGDGHPKSRAVVTPIGRFGSVALAAEAYGFTRQYGGQLARTCSKGWMYEDEIAISMSAELEC